MRPNVAPTTSLRNASALNKASLRYSLIGLLLATLGVCGYWLLFTQFMVYDDEGYVLWSLHNYFQEGGLYTKVYSQYGPFLYALYDGIHRLFGLAFDNETGRLLTLFYWLSAAGLSGVFAWRQTRSSLTTAAAISISFATLLIMISEPIHPGGLIAMITAIAAVGGALALEKKAYCLFALLCGTCGAALVLIKINVGAFFLIASGSWFVIHLAKAGWARALLWFTAGGSILLPLWLMNKFWPAPWVAIFALAFSCAALALLLLFKAQSRPPLRPKHLFLFAGSAACIAFITLFAVWIRGTDIATLWHGIAIAPLGQPIAYAHAVNWPDSVPLLIVVTFGFALLSQYRTSSWLLLVIAIARILVAAAIVVTTFKSIDNRLTLFSFHYSLPFAWLMAVPILRQDPPLVSARLWLAWIFIWQTLHAYPVAGSQMGWGSFLWMALAVTGIYEAIQYGIAHYPKYRHAITVSASTAAAVTILSLVWNLGYVSYQRFQFGEPLQLHGAKSLRLNDDNTLIYRILAKNIRAHGDTLFSYPGLYSLNIWTERPTPTAHNVTHWFSLLNESQQDAILEKLKADDRAVIAVQSYLINYLVYHGFPPRSKLQRYIVDNFHTVFAIDTFQFWVKKNRSVAPLSTAGLFTNVDGSDSILQLVTDASGVATTIEIRGLFHPYNRVMALPPSASQAWEITPLDADNSPTQETVSATRAVALQGITRIEIPIPSASGLPKLDILKVVIKDESGAVLDSLGFTQ